MTAQTDPYVRVYYSITDDPKFADVYDDDAALALWLRLLIVADAIHPAAAPLPVVNPDALAMLVAANLVDLVGTTRYRIHGLVKERERRSSNARASANARWSDATAMRPHSTSDATASERIMRPDATAMRPHSRDACEPMLSEPSLAEPSLAEPSQADPSSDEQPDALDVFARMTGSFPSSKVIPWINELCETYGEAEVCTAMAKAWTDDDDRGTLIGRVRDRLAAEKHRREKAYERRERAREKREQERIEEMPIEQRAENLAKLRAEMVKSGLLSPEDL